MKQLQTLNLTLLWANYEIYVLNNVNMHATYLSCLISETGSVAKKGNKSRTLVLNGSDEAGSVSMERYIVKMSLKAGCLPSLTTFTTDKQTCLWWVKGKWRMLEKYVTFYSVMFI